MALNMRATACSLATGTCGVVVHAEAFHILVPVAVAAVAAFTIHNSRIKKEPATTYSRTGGSRTTLGDGAFDFRVRNGNGYGSSSMVTGKKPEAGS